MQSIKQMFSLYRITGDALAFVHAQKGSTWQRSSDLPGNTLLDAFQRITQTLPDSYNRAQFCDGPLPGVHPPRPGRKASSANSSLHRHYVARPARTLYRALRPVVLDRLRLPCFLFWKHMQL
jgi:hypothetical protein